MLSQLGSIMFLQASNLLYDDRSLFSLGVHVTEAQPRCVHHFPWAFCFENHQIMQAVPLEDGRQISFTNSLQYIQCLGRFIYSSRHHSAKFSCCTQIVQK